MALRFPPMVLICSYCCFCTHFDGIVFPVFKFAQKAVLNFINIMSYYFILFSFDDGRFYLMETINLVPIPLPLYICLSLNF